MGDSITPSGTGILSESYAITIGQPAFGGVPEGNVMVGAKVMDALSWLTVIERDPAVPDWVKFTDSEEGLPGMVPAS